MPLTEAWTSTSLTGRCGRNVTLLDENREKSGVRSPDEHSNNSRTTSCRSGSSCTVWVSSGGTGFPTIPPPPPPPAAAVSFEAVDTAITTATAQAATRVAANARGGGLAPAARGALRGMIGGGWGLSRPPTCSGCIYGRSSHRQPIILLETPCRRANTFNLGHRGRSLLSSPFRADSDLA